MSKQILNPTVDNQTKQKFLATLILLQKQGLKRLYASNFFIVWSTYKLLKSAIILPNILTRDLDHNMKENYI